MDWRKAIFINTLALGSPQVRCKDNARAVLGSGVRRATRERIQGESLARLGALGVPLRKLELLLDGAATADAVLGLSRSFDA